MADTDEARQRPGTTDRGFFGRIALFIRQVVAELRKVIWPTRRELIGYTIIVLIFVGIMAAIVGAYDFVFTKAVLFVFGGGASGS
mgnify:CR=1 FL=1